MTTPNNNAQEENRPMTEGEKEIAAGLDELFAGEDWREKATEIANKYGEKGSTMELSLAIRELVEEVESLSRKEARREANLIRQEAIEECRKVVSDYGERMSELHSEMIATSHEDSKMMLAYDMHSRLIAVKHITEKMKSLSALEKLTKDTQ